jgi:hypothetical protein
MIIFSFDVIAAPNEELGARQPIPEGRRLWNIFAGSYNGRIAVLGAGVTNTPLFLEWLKKEGFKASTVDVIDQTSAQAKIDRVTSLNAVYGRIDWYVDIDPGAIAGVLHTGIPSILVSVPFTVRPEWMDKRQVKGWATLVDEIESQTLAKAERTWNDPRV